MSTKKATTTPTPSRPRTEAALLERIRAAMGELKLATMAHTLEQLLEADQPWPSALEVVCRLLDDELGARRERSVARRIKQARFPAHRTLEQFDFVFQTGVNRDEIERLASLHWLERRQSLLLAGMSGTGKSHLAIALGHLACVAGYRVRYTTSAAMLSELHLAHATQTLQQALRPYVRCELLILDEVGLDLPERRQPGADDAGVFYKVIAARYEATRSTLLTSNIDWEQWGEYLGDEIATAAILDRLVHHSYTITINGPSYRLAAHERLNRGAVGDEVVAADAEVGD